MKNLSTISTDLFHKIRSTFTDIKIGDQEGRVTTNPENARFFDVNYSIENNDLGRVNIKLDDDSLTLIYNESMLDDQEALKSDWFEFLRDMRQFAKRNMLRFDTRDITKSNLDQRDYQYLAQKTGENAMSESKLFGTSKTSYQDIGTAKIIVKHSAPVNYDNPAGRSQRIDSIYVESEAGERFRYPHKHLNGARAMAMHINNGGTAYDEIGGYISGLSEELSKLKQFKNYASRSGVVSETLNDLNQRVLDRMESIRSEIYSLQKDHSYKEFASRFSPQPSVEVPDDIRNNWVDALTIKTFNEELTDVFPYLYKLVNEQPKELNYDDIVAEEKEVCDDCGKDPCECDDVKEDSMFAEFEDQMDEITTFDYEMPEGRMSEIDIDLQTLANRGDEEDLIAALEGEMGPEVAEVLQNMMDEVKDELASKGMNDIMNDQDKMIEILWDKIVNEYVGNESIEQYDEAYGKYKDLDDKTGDRLADWMQEWADFANDSDDYGLASNIIGMIDDLTDGKIGFRDVQEFVFRVADEPTSPLRKDFITNFAPNKIKKTQPDLFDNDQEKDKDDLPFTPDENPTDKDEFGNTIKHRAKHLAKKGMKSVMPKEVVEFISSLYDRESGTFPKGEEGVKIAVEKRFGEQAGRFAGFVVEKLSAKEQLQGDVMQDDSELSRVRELAGFQSEESLSGTYYYEKLAQEVFDMNPNLDTSGRADELLNAAFPLMVRDLGSKKRANNLLNYDEDFTSDFVSAYGELKRNSNQESISPELADLRKLSGL